MDLLKPNGKLDNSYDDGRPDYDWSHSGFSFCFENANKFVENLKEKVQEKKQFANTKCLAEFSEC